MHILGSIGIKERPRIHPEGAILSSGTKKKFFGFTQFTQYYCRIWAITDAPELFQFPFVVLKFSYSPHSLLPNYAHANAYLFKHANHTFAYWSNHTENWQFYYWKLQPASIYVPFRPRRRRISLFPKVHFPAQCTVFENHRKSLIQHCKRRELRLQFEWTKDH